MKYINVYDEEIRKEYDTIKRVKRSVSDSKQKYQWAVMYTALNNPSLSNEQLCKKIREMAKGDLSEELILEILNDFCLTKVGGREKVARNAQEFVIKFKDALDGNAAMLSECMNEVRDGRYKRIGGAKLLLVYALLIDDELKREEGECILTVNQGGFCFKLFQNICIKLEKELKIKKSVKDAIKDAEQTLQHTKEDTRNSKVVEGLSEKELLQRQIEELKFENDNYKNAVNLIQNMFDDLKENIEESTKEAQNAAVSDFFTELNSDANKNILDSLVRVNELLRDLRRNRVEIPLQVQPLIIIFKALYKFIENYGITKIEEVGHEFKAKYEDIAGYNYLGMPYESDDEVKLLKVVAPGWKYNDVIISIPTVQEVE